MKTTAALVTFSVLVAFVWRLTERLQDDSLAMLLGFGAGIVVLVIVVVAMLGAMRMGNADRANERRHHDGRAERPQPPVIVITGRNYRQLDGTKQAESRCDYETTRIYSTGSSGDQPNAIQPRGGRRRQISR